MTLPDRYFLHPGERGRADEFRRGALARRRREHPVLAVAPVVALVVLFVVLALALL